ncbi:MAG: hypothetical protein HOO95_00870 [Gallionella sp.]|nr:hypothetical protein [Gallionella sp.]
MSVTQVAKRSSISIYNPAVTVCDARLEEYGSNDVYNLEAAQRILMSVEQSLKDVQQLLSSQSGRGRQFNLSALYQARCVAHAYLYPIELILERGKNEKGVS